MDVGTPRRRLQIQPVVQLTPHGFPHQGDDLGCLEVSSGPYVGGRRTTMTTATQKLLMFLRKARIDSGRVEV